MVLTIVTLVMQHAVIMWALLLVFIIVILVVQCVLMVWAPSVARLNQVIP